MANEVDEYLDALKRLGNVETDAELAALAGIAKQTVSSWRRRGAVPAKSQQAFARQFGTAALANPSLRYWKESREWQLAIAVMLAAFDINSGRSPLDFGDYVKWGGALAHSEDAIRQAMRKLDSATGKDRDAALVEMMLVMIRSGGISDLDLAVDIWVNDRLELGPQ